MWKKILSTLAVIGIGIVIMYVAMSMTVFTQVLFNTNPALGAMSAILMAATVVCFLRQEF